MYKELFRYVKHMRGRKELWKDGELFTAVVAAAISVPTFIARPELMDGIRAQFESLLTAASIVFGFALATLTFYIASVSQFAKSEKKRRVADKLVDWHVWTVLSLLLLVLWILAIWGVDAGVVGRRFCYRIAGYAGLVFLTFYSGGQVVNHCLTLWWYHYRRAKLEADDGQKSEGDDSADGSKPG